MNGNFITISCLEIEQPIGPFYCGVINSTDLVRISYADIRRLEEPKLDKYLGIQRELSQRRVDELERFVNTPDATFPTGVVIALASEDADFDPGTNAMHIRDGENVARIIDGQHRIAGLKLMRGDHFQMCVSIFIDMDIEDQAMVFATINLAQTRVNRSLLYDLYEYAKKPSPQKTAHNIARLLNTKPGSPFQFRIKILGTARPDQKRWQLITQATFVEAVVSLISGTIEKANDDRDLLKVGRKPARATEDEQKTMIFRNMFIEGRDAEIARVLWHYFKAVQTRWPDAWNNTELDNVLPRAIGFRVFMQLLPILYAQLGNTENIPLESEFMRILEVVPLTNEDFGRDKYRQGAQGEYALFNDLLANINDLVSV